MGLSVGQLLESLSAHGILPAAEIATLRELPTAAKPEADAEQLLRELVQTKKLTKFQALNLYQGRAKALAFGEYLILDKLGAGAMGQVYKAQHRRMKRIVALKVLPPKAVGSQRAVDRFYQEVEVAAKLTHPNIVTAYDAGEAHGMLYLVMEYVEGKNLSAHLVEHGPMSLEQTLNVVLQAARGLAYAHGLGIVHRDVKPGNLLADRHGVVKVLDMGLARIDAPLSEASGGDKELTAGGEVMGTMEYMAPEQAVDTRSADHRADIYSLGCTLYRLYIGKTPYVGETAVQKILAHRDQPIPSLKAARPETPEQVERLYQKMMAKKPAERIQTMAAVVSTLEQLLAGADGDASSVILAPDQAASSDDVSFLGGATGAGASGIGVASVAESVSTTTPSLSLSVAPPVGGKSRAATAANLKSRGSSAGRKWLMTAVVAAALISAVGAAWVLLQRRGSEETVPTEPVLTAKLPPVAPLPPTPRPTVTPSATAAVASPIAKPETPAMTSTKDVNFFDVTSPPGPPQPTPTAPSAMPAAPTPAPPTPPSPATSAPSSMPDKPVTPAVSTPVASPSAANPSSPPVAPAANVNLAAAFDRGGASEGVVTGVRGEIEFAAEPNKIARLAFAPPPTKEYSVTAVVERRDGHDVLALNLPLDGRRVAAIIDWRIERFSGLYYLNSGGADLNPTGRRHGFQLLHGEQHVVKASAVQDPKGWRVRVSVDGREIVDYAGNDFAGSGEFDPPDPRALAIATMSSGWRILRFDVAAADGRRAATPEVEARTQAAESVRSLTSPADAKGASLDAKLAAVDLLRRRGAMELDQLAVRYVALEEALRIAAAAGDLTGAYEAAEDLNTAFDVNPRVAQRQVLEVFKVPRPQAAARQQFVEEALKLTDVAAKCEQWEYALDLNAALDKFAGGSNPDLKRELKARAVEYEFALSLVESAQAARVKPANTANDASAQADGGRYACFALGDWPRGLAALAKGDDPALQAAAVLDRNDPKSGDERFALGEKWWETSEKEKSLPLKWAEAERAAFWYRRAAANLADKSRQRLDQRLKQSAQLQKSSGGAMGPRRPLDAVKIGDHWYRFYPAMMTWDAAVQTCELHGGNLLIFNTPAEEEAITQYVLQSLAGKGQERVALWLGASDADQEGFFRRLDGAPLTPPNYVHWADGSPNNANGDEDYVMTDISLQNGAVTSLWNDLAKVALCYFVCEWDH